MFSVFVGLLFCVDVCFVLEGSSAASHPMSCLLFLQLVEPCAKVLQNGVRLVEFLLLVRSQAAAVHYREA